MILSPLLILSRIYSTKSTFYFLRLRLRYKIFHSTPLPIVYQLFFSVTMITTITQNTSRQTLMVARPRMTTFRSFSTSSKFQYTPDHVKKITETTGPLMKKIARRQVFSGIQPTGGVHLGNYLGALVNWKVMQDTEFANLHINLVKYLLSAYHYHTKAAELSGKSNEESIQHGIEGIVHSLSQVIHHEGDTATRFTNSNILYSVVDLHAITVPQDPLELRRNCDDLMRLLLAIGLSPEKSTLFFQSHCQYHTELSWLLTCITPISWLYRMTQFKDKAAKTSGTTHNEEASLDESSTNNGELLRGVNIGLLSYPILMASDILAYNATHIPVGHDQLQHIELTRDIARTFNATYATKKNKKKGVVSNADFKPFMFDMPEAILNEGAARVMSLRSPTSKMSKSDPSEASRIHLTDNDDAIIQKIRKATTDSTASISYDIENRPGISNLIDMVVALENTQVKREHTRSLIFTTQGHPMYDYINSTAPLQSLLNAFVHAPTQALHDLMSYHQLLESLVTDNYGGKTSHEAIVAQCEGANANTSYLKNLAAEKLIAEIAPIRAEYQKIQTDNEYLASTVNLGAKKAQDLAQENLTHIYKTMGYVPRNVTASDF